ncbi:hypothetical protein B566_EDAN015532 [Ephemera danica]|nr:hypothetical protein B566_EDAN015532 [Ephemera danica]
MCCASLLSELYHNIYRLFVTHQNFYSMLQFLLRISRQHIFIGCFNLSPTKTVLIRTFHKVEVLTQTHHIQKCFLSRNVEISSCCKNNSNTKVDKHIIMDSRSSSPEIVEVIERKKSPKEDDSGSSDTSSKRRRDTTEQDPKDGLYFPRRQWRNTRLGARVKCEGMRPNAIAISVMSYNVLSQELLVQHPYLYYNHNPEALPWPGRHARFINEIKMHLSDILCLQEVQLTHFQDYFKQPLAKLGYEGIYKQRTGNKVDGCALFWKRNNFGLLEQSSVEFYQPGVDILNRDNIAIIARLGVKGSEDQIVVATTHLLYNPRRYDIRLAQTQLLLAELDRLSHAGNNVARYPVILTGDFNLKPHSTVYKLLTRGEFQQPEEGRVILPMDLGITDCCRHHSLLQHRESSKYVSRNSKIITEELSQLQIYHSERTQTEQKITHEQFVQRKQWFGSGNLSHVLLLQSAYEHPRDIERAKEEVTTHQDDWVTVDYIFYSNDQSAVPRNRRKLRLVSRWSLPTVAECIRMGPIPNFNAPSDHLPLVACFLLS